MYQQITIIGHAGADAQMRYTPAGLAVASVSVATNRRRDGADVTTWHRVTAWGKLAEIVAEHVKRGDRLLVTGRVEARAFADQRTGEPRCSLEVTAETVRFLGGNAAERGRPTGAVPMPDAQPDVVGESNPVW